ncbi:hypothetical protein JCM3765_002977 [Sporobolomyces pararoseus]
MAATVASPSSPIISPPSPSPNNHNKREGNGNGGKPQSRMFRTLSRFLSGGGSSSKQNKQNNNSRKNEQQSSNSNNASPQPREQLGLGGGEEYTSQFDGSSGGFTSSSMRAQYPDDSLSHISRQSSSASIRSTSTTSTSRRPPRSKRTEDEDDADTDASIYRLPPSTRGPSSINSGNSSSFAPTHASTYRSTASTKPTTLLSVDSTGGANRIAVVPGTGQSQSQSQNSQALPPTFSSLSPPLSTPPLSSPTFTPSHAHRPSTSSTTSSLLSSSAAASPIPQSPSSQNVLLPQAEHLPSLVGIPSHTQVHPRNNPHPSGIPTDNASLLTLASSGFAPSFTLSTHTTYNKENNEQQQQRSPGGGRSSGTWGGGGLNSLKAWSQKRGQTGGAAGGGNSSSKLVNSGSSLLDGFGASGPGGGGGEGIADEDASVRVLPGSRRNSEDSLGGKSTWSAQPSGGGGGGLYGGGASRKSVVSVKVGDYDQDQEEFNAARERRRSSMKTVETGYTGKREDEIDKEAEEEEEKAFETETEEATNGAGETAAEGVKKRAEERGIKGKGVDEGEHEGLKELAPPVGLA